MMSKTPFFSIITCTYNSDKTLSRTIESVKNQTFKDFEHIFIDANSTDSTQKLIKGYQKTSSSVKIYKYPPKGISDAMNMGISHARGKYIIHLHGDDYLYSDDVLQKAYNYLKDQKYDWVYGQINTFDETNSSIGIFPKRKIFQIASSLLLQLFNFIPHQAVFIKKEVFNKFGIFDESIKIAMDYEFWLRIAPKTTWKYIDLIVSNYGLSSTANSSSSANKHQNTKEYKIIQKKHTHPLIYPISFFIHYLISILGKTYR